MIQKLREELKKHIKNCQDALEENDDMIFSAILGIEHIRFQRKIDNVMRIENISLIAKDENIKH